MVWAQWTVLVFFILGLGMAMGKVGESRGVYDGPYFIGQCLALALYLCAGVFDAILGWPK